MSDRWMEIKVLAWRWFIHSKRRPIVVFAGLFQPLIWLLLFSAVFKNSPMSSLVTDGSYLAFITPGALVFTAFTGALNGGLPILFDREQGFLDRLLVAPLTSRLSIIWATGIHIFVMSMLQCVVIIGLTWIMGVRLGGGFQGAGLVILLLGLITMLFTTLSLTLAFVLRYHFELLSTIMIVSLPLAFISTAFAPVAYMPKWLTYFVTLNPITLTVEPLRAVFFADGWTWMAPIFDSPFGGLSIAACTIILAVVNLLTLLGARAIIAKKLA